ncbi:hypothetical protein [Saliterribacillus persicus]|uniref:Uncharacterized protein n=1 Tax=Saliterribacillus persicus TaxID=930114 RepID=A0A368XT24_9BACI|nr:hypothetical protein DFR57_10626 [Saliterribacillus persicus]
MGKILKLYEFAGRSSVLFFEQSQMTIEEFEKIHESVEYIVNLNGTATVEGQMSTEDLPAGEPNEVNFDYDDLLDT